MSLEIESRGPASTFQESQSHLWEIHLVYISFLISIQVEMALLAGLPPASYVMASYLSTSLPSSWKIVIRKTPTPEMGSSSIE